MLLPEFFPRAKTAIDRGSHTMFDLVGYTPQFLSTNDTDDAVTQLNKHYGHGGGWQDFNGFALVDKGDPNGPSLLYEGDPPTQAIAEWKLRDERIVLFDHAWVAVIQPDGSFRVARMD